MLKNGIAFNAEQVADRLKSSDTDKDNSPHKIKNKLDTRLKTFEALRLLGAGKKHGEP